MEQSVKTFSEYLKAADNIAFFGGAGVSTESGLKDYRSKDGIYFTAKNFGRPPEQILSSDCFFDDTELFYRFYREFFLADALPGAAHKALQGSKRKVNLSPSLHKISTDFIRRRVAVMLSSFTELRQAIPALNAKKSTRRNKSNRTAELFPNVPAGAC